MTMKNNTSKEMVQLMHCFCCKAVMNENEREDLENEKKHGRNA
jgi:hypothetical protein